MLPRLYQQIVIPGAVCDELKSPRAPQAVRDWATRNPAWLEIRIPERQPDAGLIGAGLDAGERDAILPALELGADELIRRRSATIWDDLDGRRGAERRKLHFVGDARRAAGRIFLSPKSGRVCLISKMRSPVCARRIFTFSQELLDRLLRDEGG